MKIIAIVAASRNHVIGINNTMPWHLPDDFKHFKAHTSGHIILMGKNTWLSLGRPLPNRKNWIISSSLSIQEDTVRVFSSIPDAIKAAKQEQAEKLFIIGGGQIYKATMDIIDTIILTKIHADIENGEVFFPQFSTDEWTLTSNVFHPKDEKHLYDFSFETWERTPK